MSKETMQLLYADGNHYQELPAISSAPGKWITEFPVLKTGRVCGVIFRSPDYGIFRFVAMDRFTDRGIDVSIQVTYNMDLTFEEK